VHLHGRAAAFAASALSVSTQSALQSRRARWLAHTALPQLGVVAIFIALGHSVLAMSGEESLAQVYREIESPKLKNLKKAGLVIFVYSWCSPRWCPSSR